MTDRLFVYGTLAPGRPNEHVLAEVSGTWEPATVKGTLLQEGWGAAVGYPGIVLDELGGEVHGFILSSEKLPSLIKVLELEDEITLPVEVKHFFSGAAVYVDGVLCASWSPVGLAFKLPDREVTHLISKGQAKPLQYFPEGHIKKGTIFLRSPAIGKSIS